MLDVVASPLVNRHCRTGQPTLRCLSRGGFKRWGVFEEPPDTAGDVAFEAADDLSLGLAFGAAPVSAGLGFGVATESGRG